MKPLRRYSAALALIPFLTQATGAADLGLVLGPAARPMLYPLPIAARLPARAAPAPKAAGVAKESSHFWSDAALVARWVCARLEESSRPAPAPVSRAPARLFRVETFGAAPEPKPSRDRVMIVKDPMIVDVAQAVRGLGVPDGGDMVIYKPRVEGKWFSSGPLRFRVVYKDSLGLSWGDVDGFHFYIPGYRQVDINALVPPAFYGDYPIYFHGQDVRFDVEIENTGGAALEDLAVSAQQEVYDEGGAGVPSDDGLIRRVRSLAPGAKTVVHGTFYVSNSGHARVNFEQTHLRIKASGKQLADEAHAGLVDPPNLDGVARE